MSPSAVYYAMGTASRFLADVGLDLLRIYFPDRWNLALPVQKFHRNLWLKLIKHAATGVCCLIFGSVVPFLWVHPVAFILSDLVATTAVDVVVSGQCGAAD